MLREVATAGVWVSAHPDVILKMGVKSVLYRTRELHPKEFPAADLVILTSASSARALAALTAGLPVVSIGPETSRAAQEAGLRIVAEALPHSSEGLAAAVAGLSQNDIAATRPTS